MLEYKPHIPRTIDEVLDQLSFMFVKGPHFEDSFFIGRNTDTVFTQLNDGLKNIRKNVGEERYASLIALSDRMRTHFDSDPHDSNGQAREGRRLARKMQEIIQQLA